MTVDKLTEDVKDANEMVAKIISFMSSDDGSEQVAKKFIVTAGFRTRRRNPVLERA